MSLHIRDFTSQDLDSAIRLWQSDENIGLSSADSPENIAAFLERNPGLSKVAESNGRTVGTLLCGHDGRRGYLYHLCVDEHYRRQGVGRSLVEACLDDLKKQGIRKCHLFVFNKNSFGRSFWKGTEWSQRTDIEVFSKDT
ncbi:MAG: GNAT family N-acetyltransferase [Chloroflexi bacterium RBG_16_57_8]|nr:MAG: GNAT family N-acetyltransferase [Chloroflexi bacterium RBG_16_57_8]